jgi:hypothetical protein
MDLIKDKKTRVDLTRITLSDLWSEIARRLNLKFGSIQMSFHNGKPSAYTNVDLKIKTDDVNDSNLMN